MARRTKVTMIDDLDGENEAVQTVAFSLDSISYEIDLSEEHAQELRTALQDYAAAGRRMGGGRAVRAGQGALRGRDAVKETSRTSSAAAPSGDVRGWARTQGFEVSSRGRISSAVREAYVAAR
jgi:hypothetical protein